MAIIWKTPDDGQGFKKSVHRIGNTVCPLFASMIRKSQSIIAGCVLLILVEILFWIKWEFLDNCVDHFTEIKEVDHDIK